MDSHFDTKKFILEIENRPAIWNSACSKYSNRDVKKKFWEELTKIFSCEDNTVQEKKEISQYLCVYRCIHRFMVMCNVTIYRKHRNTEVLLEA